MNAKDAREYTQDCKLYNVVSIIKEACKSEMYSVEVSPAITDYLLLMTLRGLKYEVKNYEGYTLISW